MQTSFLSQPRHTLQHFVTNLRRALVLAGLSFCLVLVLIGPATHVMAEGQCQGQCQDQNQDQSQGQSSKGKPPKSKPNTVILRIDPNSGTSIETINRDYGTTTFQQIPYVENAYVVKTTQNTDAKPIADKMSKDRRLLYAEINIDTEPPEADPRSIGTWGGFDSTRYYNQTFLSLLNLPAAQAISRGAGSVVAVLDTGVQLDHPALAGSLTDARFDFVDNDDEPNDDFNGLDDNGNGMVDEVAGHGTHIAGIIHLVAPDAKIMPLRVLDSDGHGFVINAVSAIAYAVQNGANVINMSFGTPTESRLLDDAVRQASRAGVVIVAAAGNLATKDQAQYPAASECALSVASVSQFNTASQFSNMGKWINFAAPGEGIYSTFPTNGYATWTGTSMASPFVAGQAALIHSVSPSLSPRMIAGLMAYTAEPVYAINKKSKGKPKVAKDFPGRIDIGASLQQLATGQLPSNGYSPLNGSCGN